MLLKIGFQGLDQDRALSFFSGDAASGDVLQIRGVPIELHSLHGKYQVKGNQETRT